MAHVIDHIPGGNRGRPPTYPYAEWSDGRIWSVRKGEDYACSHRSFSSNVRAWANRNHLTVSLYRVKEDGEQVGWAIQFSSNGSA